MRLPTLGALIITTVLMVACTSSPIGTTAPTITATETPAIASQSQATPAETPTAQRLNTALRDELLQMEATDQSIRQEVAIALGASRTISQTLLLRLQEIDTQHTERMKQIIAEHGWPGTKLVGRDGAAAAWVLVQHADHDVVFQRQCLELIAQAAAQGEARIQDVAYLTDRVLINEGKEQLYGTQHWDDGPVRYLLPLQDPDQVNDRRREVGLSPLPEPLRIKPLPLPPTATP